MSQAATDLPVEPAALRLPADILFIERDWLSSNQVLLRDPGGNTLVDTGYVKHADLTLALVQHGLQTFGRGQPLLRVLNTHLHSDHCGGNARLVSRHGCPVYVSLAQARALADWDEDALSYSDTGQHCERFSAAGYLSPGDDLDMGGAHWQVLAAPGHDPHSLVFHCPEHRLLISADALWENGFGVIFSEVRGQSGFAEQAAILDVIAALDVETVIPGHGRLFTDVPAAIERARSRLRALREDPSRNARNAVKVLVKFHLLDNEHTTLAAMTAKMRPARFVQDAAALLGMDTDRAIAWAAEELVRAGQLRREGGELHNA